MTSLIGNNLRQRIRGQGSGRITKPGFTLVEVMVATAVISLGMVLVYQAFFTVLDSFNYCAHYLDVVSAMNEKIWEAQNSLSSRGPAAEFEGAGELVSRNKSFNWTVTPELIDGDGNTLGLYKINLRLLWREGKRERELLRTAYAIYDKK